MLSAIAQGRTPLRRSSSRLARRTTDGEANDGSGARRRRALQRVQRAPGREPAPPSTTRAGPATRSGSSPTRSHPFGVALDYLIFRPAWWVGTHEPLRTIFGVQVVVDDSAEVARAVQQDYDKSVPLPPPEPTTPDDSPREVPDPQD